MLDNETYPSAELCRLPGVSAEPVSRIMELEQHYERAVFEHSQELQNVVAKEPISESLIQAIDESERTRDELLNAYRALLSDEAAEHAVNEAAQLAFRIAKGKLSHRSKISDHA